MKNIWWTQVTNATHFISDIKQAVLDEKSILLNGSCKLPWRDYFEETIVEAVRSQNGEKTFVKITTSNEPGEYLLAEFCKKEKRAEYRPSKGYVQFFAENDDIVLHDRYFWVSIDKKELLDSWMSFVSGYTGARGKNRNKAVFLLEFMSDETVSARKGIRSFSLYDYIGEYDRIVFAVLATAGIKETSFIKQYLAEMLANIIGNDVELAAECIGRSGMFKKDPYGCIKEIIKEKQRSNGEDYTYNKTQKEVEHAIWLSQIRTVFPYLEEYREGFVQKHIEEIAAEMPIQTSYGEFYYDPKEVELGTLVYMANNGNLGLNHEEYNELLRYKEARNRLSHLSVLTIDEIIGLL